MFSLGGWGGIPFVTYPKIYTQSHLLALFFIDGKLYTQEKCTGNFCPGWQYQSNPNLDQLHIVCCLEGPLESVHARGWVHNVVHTKKKWNERAIRLNLDIGILNQLVYEL